MTEQVVKEGWIQKRGEVVKNWRYRYFLLKANGYLYGYKDKADDPTATKNEFYVSTSVVKKSDSPTPNCFIIRLLEGNVFKERYFKCEDPKSRDDWVDALQKISTRNRTSSMSRQFTSD